MKHLGPVNTEVVIVDDNPQYSMILKKMLQSLFGYKQVEVLSELDQAEQRLCSCPTGECYRLLFVDYHFPNGRTGAELLRHLQEKELFLNTVCFLITAEPSMENMKEASASGAMGVIAKPFDRDELRRQLDKAERLLSLDSDEG